MTRRMYLDIGGAFPVEVSPAGPLPMTNRQEATTIAALKLWRMLLLGEVDLAGPVERIRALTNAATDFDLHDPLTADEITELLADCFKVAA